MSGRSARSAGQLAMVAKVACDALLFALAYAIVSILASGRWPDPGAARTIIRDAVLVVPIQLASFHLFGAYRALWRYASLESLRSLFGGAAVGAAATEAVAAVTHASLFPSALALGADAALAFLLASYARIVVRLAGLVLARPAHVGPRTLVVGAGDAGEMIVREMRRHARLWFDPVGFVDDDASKRGSRIHGVRVLGSRRDIVRLAALHRIETIVIAIPSASADTLQGIIAECRRTRADVRILPDLGVLMDPSVGLSRVRPLDIPRLLRRGPVEKSRGLVAPLLDGRCVLVTGAGGSIGSELCRQILRFAPSRLILLGRGENSIHQIHQELMPIAGRTVLVQVIADFRDKEKLTRVFAACRPDVVFHAGAHKHVPLMELCPDEAVLNNVIGTRNVLELANAVRCEKVVCISSDKAVRPSSVMGRTKRVAELLIRSPMYSNTSAVAVRFGNVFGSRGSVIPRFQDQIERGGPLTVTDKKMSRYFMTIPEAVELVLVAGAMGRGREIFVLEMGSPLRIWDLAGEMARLKGLEPGVDIELRETGLRPGEKLQEELFQDDELREATEHPRITRTIHPGADPSWLRMSIENLENLATDMDLDAVRRELARVVVEGDAVAAHELMPTFEESTLRHDSHPERTRRRWSEPAIESAT